MWALPTDYIYKQTWMYDLNTLLGTNAVSTVTTLQKAFTVNLFIVESPRGVNGEEQGGHVANEKGIEGGSNHHADYSEPGLSDVLRRPPAKPNAQHMRDGFEEGPRVLLSYCGILKWNITTNCMKDIVQYWTSVLYIEHHTKYNYHMYN